MTEDLWAPGATVFHTINGEADRIAKRYKNGNIVLESMPGQQWRVYEHNAIHTGDGFFRNRIVLPDTPTGRERAAAMRERRRREEQVFDVRRALEEYEKRVFGGTTPLPDHLVAPLRALLSAIEEKPEQPDIEWAFRIEAQALRVRNRRLAPPRARNRGERLMDWQPIETAPKDGTSVIVATSEGIVGEAALHGEDGWWWVNAYDAYWAEPICIWSGEVTHWMPRPQPPKEGK